MKKINLFFFLFFLFFPIIYASSYLSIPDLIIKDEEIYFYFDAFYLLSKETDAVINSSYFIDWSYNCYIKEGNADLELIGASLTIQEYKLIGREYGRLVIRCKASIKNEKEQIFEAEVEKTVFVADDLNRICNENDLLISISPDPIEIKYLEDLVPLVYKLLKENREQKVDLPIEVSIDYSGILGRIENPVLYCEVNDDHFKLIQDFELNDLSFDSTLNLFLIKNISSYFPSFSIDCDFRAYCDFYGNEDLSKAINKSFSIIVEISPINESSFILVYNATQSFKSSYFDNLIRNYSIRSALQQFEMKLSPFISGIPGVLIDIFLNPAQITISQLIALSTPLEACPCTTKLSAPFKAACNPITGSGIGCLSQSIIAFSAASTCPVPPPKNAGCLKVASITKTSISYYKTVYKSLAWIPLFFTTSFTILPLELTVNTVCDPVQKWIYSITGEGAIFPVLNLYRYPPILPENFAENILKNASKVYKKIVDHEKSNFNLEESQEYFAKVNQKISEIQSSFNNNPFMTPYNTVKQASSKIAGPFKSATDKSKEIAMSILTNIASEQFADWLIGMFTTTVCSVDSIKDNPSNRAGQILMDYFNIVMGVSAPEFSQITRHFPFQIMMNLLELSAHFIKSKEQCIFFNTFAPLSYLNKSFESFGMRVELKEDFDLDFEWDIKKRKYSMCPGEISNALSKYLTVLMANQRCFYSALNWVYYKNIDPNFDGDLTKLLNNDLTRFLLSYSSISFVEAKYSLLLTDYNSIKELAYCSNLRKYINCLEKEAVNQCKKNKLKISTLYLSKTASTIFSKYVSRFITNLIFKYLENAIPGLCGKLSSLKGILKIATFALQFKSAIDNYKSAAKCFEEFRQINYSNVNLNDIEEIRFDKKCKQEYENSLQGLNCLFNPKKCSLAGWLSFLSTILDPNSVDNYIKAKIDQEIDKIIKKLIKKGADKCQFEEDTFNYDLILLDQILEINEDINEYFIETSENLNFQTGVSFKAIVKEKELLRKSTLQNCDPFDCNLIKAYYPLEEEGNFCIYKVTKKDYDLKFQANFDKCELYLVFEKVISGGTIYEKEKIKDINSCSGIKKITLEGNTLINKIKNYVSHNNRFVRGVYLEIWPYEGNSLIKESKISIPLDYKKMEKESYYVENC
ncbi:MAG TPA: hypothetical protein EYH54_00520 [Nautiliaceae bacterium]|nr:hypothetical protein [Nautiliaceae bacterium]